MSEPVTLGEPGAARDAIVGQSGPMQSIYKEIGRIANKPVNVLIRGETGTGKEVIARAIYQNSDRGKQSFVAINCAAIPETLLESELFGHERGAYTGATGQRIGRFEQANHGTIFLDEIGDMTPGTQVKLLRVLQEKCLQRLGGRETIPVDVRVLAATHHDLETAIREKLFREDLYYRLNVVMITLPPLRQRKEDIPALVRFFLTKYGPELGNNSPSIHAEALEILQGHTWPGNVRELENSIRKALLLSQDYTVNADHVRAALIKDAGRAGGKDLSLGEFIGELLAEAQRGESGDVHARVLESAERELFRQAIDLAHGNQAKAARWLGVSRITMKAKLVQFGFHPGTDGEVAG
jgi:transcriptional regulator with PAS, ATPase and Fis domain